MPLPAKPKTGTASPAAQSGSAAPAQPAKAAPKKSSEVLNELFANGKCITAPSGSFPVKDDTRNLLALFDNGRFLVSSEHKFDGRVLSFEVLARKKKLQVNKAEYVPSNLIKAIYDRAEKEAPEEAPEETGSAADLEQLQMQKDYVAVLSKAAAVKVSDVHVVVGTHKTEVFFRQNGMM